MTLNDPICGDCGGVLTEEHACKEDDVPFLVTDSKIDREEEGRGL